MGDYLTEKRARDKADTARLVELGDNILECLEADPNDYEAAKDLLNVAMLIGDKDISQADKYARIVRTITAKKLRGFQGDDRYYYLYRNSLKFSAYYDFDSYMLFLEIERDPEKRFYLPRREIIRPIVNDLQLLADDKLDILSISTPPGIGKSTVGTFYTTWEMGKKPDRCNLISAHSDKITKSMYGAALTIINDHTEYMWQELFPLLTEHRTNAMDETIDLGKPKRFKTLTCRSIDGSLTGDTRCDNLLYSDDLISGIEEALSPDRLDTLYDKYANNLSTRRKQLCKELHIATRWSTRDVIGRIESQNSDNPRVKITAYPALDENDESLWKYDYNVGFDTEYFIKQRDKMDKVSWLAQFQNEPIDREGLLFPEDELIYYNGELPEGEPDRIIAVADIAWGGGDSLSMPIGYKYGETVYIVDWVFNNHDKSVTKPIVAAKLQQHMPHEVEMEANNGGDEYADDINHLLREQGVKLNITHRKAPANTIKMSRIIRASSDIKRFIFLDRKHRNEDYKKAMNELMRFTQNGKNKHDDAADSMAMLFNKIDKKTGYVYAIKRPC